MLRIAADGKLFLTEHGAAEDLVPLEIPAQGYKGDSVMALQQHFAACLLSGEPSESEGLQYLSTVLAVGIAVGAETLIRLYLGADFTEGAGILRLVLLAAVPYSLYTVVRNVIDASHELGVTTLILAAGFGIFCLGASGLFAWQDKLHVVLLSFLAGVVTLWLLASAETLRILRPSPKYETTNCLSYGAAAGEMGPKSRSTFTGRAITESHFGTC